MLTSNLKSTKVYKKISYGFTLIELLIVIVIIGILAGVLLVAIDPVEQINRANDSGRVNVLSGIGHAIAAYYTSQQALPPPSGWLSALQSSGDLSSSVALPSGAVACTAPNALNIGGGTVCYAANGTSDFLIWTGAVSKNAKIKAGTISGGIVTPCANYTAYVYDSSQGGKVGLTCLATAATVPTAGLTLN